MALTRNFKETVQARVLADPAFREALLREGIEAMLAGDVDTGKLILRDYIKATVGFEELGAETGTSAKSLIRMFGARGNPQARNFFAVLSRLQERAGLRVQVTTRPRRRTTAPTRNAKALNRTAAVARRVGAANC